MKKIISLLIAAVTLTAVFASCSAEPGVPTGFQLASVKENDFVLVVPNTWTVSQREGTVSAYCSIVDPSSVSVMAGNLNISLDDWWAENKTKLEDAFAEVRFLNEEDATLGGVKGKCYTFTATLAEGSDDSEETVTTEVGDETKKDSSEKKEEPITYYYEITAVKKGSVLYMFTFTSTPDRYDDHTDALEDIKENFKFR